MRFSKEEVEALQYYCQLGKEDAETVRRKAVEENCSDEVIARWANKSAQAYELMLKVAALSEVR